MREQRRLAAILLADVVGYLTSKSCQKAKPQGPDNEHQ